MKTVLEYSAALACHPEAFNCAARAIKARICWKEAGVLALAYRVEGDIQRLSIPPSRPPGRTDYLWQHTCFEAFVSANAESEYWEFNFSPSGEWAVYSFRRYRDGVPLQDPEFRPAIAVHRTNDHFGLDAKVQLHRLPAALRDGRLRLGLSAVIEEENGSVSYWALKHPPGKPDFHHSDGFALEIGWPQMEVANE